MNNNSNNNMSFKRRNLLLGGMLGTIAQAFPATGLHAQEALLPLKTPGLDHLDVIVPDVEATTKFYMGVLNTTLHAQPFRGAFRYFVLLGELREGREVGYVAVGDSAGRGQYIGHFCTAVYDYRQNSQSIFSQMAEAFEAAGFGEFPGSTGFGGIFADPDGLEIQFLPAPDTLVTAAVPSDLVEWNKGLVTPHGVDHVVLQVSDLERAISYYRILYGQESSRTDERADFVFPASSTTLILEQSRYEYGMEPKIARFGIKVSPFNRATVAAVVAALGGTVLESDIPGSLRFSDVDGNVAELVPA
jgi:catechol 2,3-dioxygenase-like lactoylglutathione lyase family enzyme